MGDENEGLAGGFDGLYDGTQGGQQGTTDAANPAWAPFFEVVPQELHHKVQPLLKDWDQKVNDRFAKVHSDYADFKGFRDNGITRQQLEQGLNLLNAISSDPHEVYKAMREAYKFQDDAPAGQGQQEPKVEEEPWKQSYESVRQQLDTVSNILLAQRQAEEQSRSDAALDKELADLRKTHGDFDEEYVLSKLVANPRTTPEMAVRAYKDWESKQMARFGPKPLFMGNGHGGLPSTGVDPRKLPEKDTRDLVAEMLQHAAQQRQ